MSSINANDVNLNDINLNSVGHVNIENLLDNGVNTDTDFKKFFAKGSLDNMQDLLKDIEASGKNKLQQDDTQPGTIY